ncbi:hypothetical protein BS47DRAFT_1394594 [Hydnum rufescens UP504]|uniref:Uncharacterized protein n=1 Tax=Hydnum rufescens UP504 TaxID=1448309 RepID=A0A9P6AUA1_9AGAM|nr:hypothetical protein BS47DRAFT_1394594 [Hydnum rufescens UP504]
MSSSQELMFEVGHARPPSPLPNLCANFLTDVDNPGDVAAALVLRKRGIIVRLIEKALDNQIGVRSTGIQDSRAIQDPGSGHRHSLEPPQMRAPVPRCLVNAGTEAILRSHLSRLGVAVELGMELVDFTQGAYKWTGGSEPMEREVILLLSSSHTISSINVLLKKRVTRKHLGVNFSGETLEKEAFLVADVDLEGLDREYWAAYGSAATRLRLALPMGPAHFSVLGNGIPDEIQKVVDGGFHAFKAYLRKIVKDDSVPIVDQTFDALTSFASVVCSSPEACISTMQDGEPIQVGDCPLDASNLVPVTAEGDAIPTTLFNLLTPFAHTALVFELPQRPPTDTEPLVPFNHSLFPRIHLMRGQGEWLGMWIGCSSILKGHARREYEVDAPQARKPFPLVVIIQPDAYICAFIHDAEEHYTSPPSLDTTEKGLRLSPLPWARGVHQEFPGRLATRTVAAVVNANPPYKQLLETWEYPVESQSGESVV